MQLRLLDHVPALTTCYCMWGEADLHVSAMNSKEAAKTLKEIDMEVLADLISRARMSMVEVCFEGFTVVGIPHPDNYILSRSHCLNTACPC